jgi:hypothetical protein
MPNASVSSSFGKIHWNRELKNKNFLFQTNLISYKKARSNRYGRIHTFSPVSE